MAHFRFPHVTPVQIGLAVLTGIVAVPLSARGMLPTMTDDVAFVAPVYDQGMADIRQQAKEDTVRIRQQRRAYWDAVQVYRRLVREGVTGITAPEIGDTESILYYLNLDAQDTAVLHAAPTDADPLRDAHTRYNELSDRWRSLVRAQVDTGRCPNILNQYREEGLQELCEILLDEKIATRQETVIHRSAAYEGGRAEVIRDEGPTLKERLRALDDSLNFKKTLTKPASIRAQ